MSPLLVCEQLVVIYQVEASEVLALQGLELSVEQGEMVGIVGSSGSGKSTLLQVISGLLRPTGGSVMFDHLNLGTASRAERDRYRREDVGFVWQDASKNLLPYLSARDNIALPLSISGARDAGRRADTLLARVGLRDRHRHRPVELSGGQQQRLALAVALAHQPRLLLADEPTGELDRETTESMFALMREVGVETDVTQVIVSHDPEVARHVDRVLSIRDGRVAAEQRLHRRADGSTTITEAVMIDSIGRLQLSDEQQEALGGSGRVHTELVDGVLHIRAATEHLEPLEPPEPPEQPEQGDGHV